MVPHDPHEDGSGDLPRLSRELEDLFAPAAGVPASAERALLDEARGHLGRVRWRVVSRRAAAAAATAAALVVVAVLVFGGSDGAAPLPGDVARDGRLDVRDAYLIAWHLRRGGDAPEGADADGDGRVDEADVRAVIRAVVTGEETP